MTEVDALFHVLHGGPPRAAEIVRRYTLGAESLESLATSFGISPERARVLVLRSIRELQAGSAPLGPEEEARLVAELFSTTAPAGPPSHERQLVDRLNAHRVSVQQRLDEAATAFASSPDRRRDEWLRRLAIVVVIALTAYFYWRDKTKPLPPPEKRPTTLPTR